MNINYSIKEILDAVNDLQKVKKNKIDKSLIKQSNKIDSLDIPKETLKLIEQAEKSKN